MRAFLLFIMPFILFSCMPSSEELSGASQEAENSSIDTLTLQNWASFMDSFSNSLEKKDTQFLKKVCVNHGDLNQNLNFEEYFDADFLNLAKLTVDKLKSELRSYESNASFDKKSSFTSEVLSDTTSIINYIHNDTNLHINCFYKFVKHGRIYTLSGIDCDSKVL